MPSSKDVKKYFFIVAAFLVGVAVGLSFAFQVGTSVLRSENENLEKDLVRVSDELARALRGEEVAESLNFSGTIIEVKEDRLVVSPSSVGGGKSQENYIVYLVDETRIRVFESDNEQVVEIVEREGIFNDLILGVAADFEVAVVAKEPGDPLRLNAMLITVYR